MASPEQLVLCAVDGSTQVATVTLNNPKALNALSAAMGQQFERVVDELAARRDVGCVVITGAGRAFSAGGDLDFLQERAFRSTPEENTNAMRAFYGRYLLPLRRLPMPVVAAVNGVAVGAAFALAMAADIRIVAESAKVSVNFTKLGLHPGMGATFVFPRTVPREVANYMLLTGRQVDGREARELGLCLKCVPDAECLAEATSIAKEIAANGRLSVLQTKESLDSQWEAGMERQLRREADAQAISYVDDAFRKTITDLVARSSKQKSKL